MFCGQFSELGGAKKHKFCKVKSLSYLIIQNTGPVQNGVFNQEPEYNYGPSQPYYPPPGNTIITSNPVQQPVITSNPVVSTVSTSYGPWYTVGNNNPVSTTSYVPNNPSITTSYVPSNPSITTSYVPNNPSITTSYVPSITTSYVPNNPINTPTVTTSVTTDNTSGKNYFSNKDRAW